jgi:hypothetical protein
MAIRAMSGGNMAEKKSYSGNASAPLPWAEVRAPFSWRGAEISFFPSTAKITKWAPVAFRMGSRAPRKSLKLFKNPGEVLIIPFLTGLFLLRETTF